MKKNIIMMVIASICLLGVIIKVAEGKSLQNNGFFNESWNFGDIGGGIIFNGNQVSFTNNIYKEKNVQDAIDELYASIGNECHIGYVKGTETTTQYACNKDTASSFSALQFESENVKYDNTSSGLEADNVSDALIELADEMPWCITNYEKQNEQADSYDCVRTIMPSTLSVTNSSVTLTYGTNGCNAYTFDGDGTLSCTSSDTTKVTCSVDTTNNVISLTPVAATETDQSVSYITITVSGTAGTQYFAPEDATFLVNVERARTATPGSCNSLTYNGTAQTLASGGSNVTYVNNSGTNASSSGTAALTTYTVTVNADANYAFSDGTSSKTLSCTIARASFTCSTSKAGYTYGQSGTGTAPSVSSNPGSGTVTYYRNASNSTSGGTAWSGTTSTSLNVGTYYMYATIAATANYNAVTCSTGSFAIAKGSTSITCKSAQNWTGNPITSYSASSNCASITNGTPTAAGTYTVTCNGGTNRNNSTCSFTINRVAGSFSCSNKTYTGSSQTACSCSGGSLSGTYAATNYSSTAYTAYCTPDGNHTIDGVTTQRSRTWTMSKAGSSITCRGAQTWTGSGITSYTSYSGCTPSSNTSPSAVGTYTVGCTGDANHNNSSCSFTINKANPTWSYLSTMNTNWATSVKKGNTNFNIYIEPTSNVSCSATLSNTKLTETAATSYVNGSLQRTRYKYTAKSTGTVYIDVSCPATANYNAISQRITVTVTSS